MTKSKKMHTSRNVEDKVLNFHRVSLSPDQLAGHYEKYCLFWYCYFKNECDLRSKLRVECRLHSYTATSVSISASGYSSTEYIVRDSSAIRRLFVRLAEAVGRQSALHKKNSGFTAPTLGLHISTFRGYQILFSIRNAYINRFTNHFSRVMLLYRFTNHFSRVMLKSAEDWK